MTEINTTPAKRCSKCGEEKPATVEYFHQRKDGKDGLNAWCKQCVSEYDCQYRVANRERIAAYRVANRERIAAYCEATRERKNERDRQRYAANRDREIERGHQYRLKNPEREAERRHRYNLANSHIKSAAGHRRRARKRALPGGWTVQHWLASNDYFHNTCAVCGGQLRDLFGMVEPHREHWIAITDPRPDNPGTVPGNMLPLCSPCNLSKGSKLPEEWLKWRYSKHKAKKILKRIHEYFEWVKQQH